MIDISKILKRAWYILWNYKILWIFGILLAITAGTAANSGSNARASYSGDGQNWQGQGYHYPESNPEIRQAVDDMNEFFEEEVEPLFATEQRAIRTAIWIVVGVFAFALLVGLLMALVRYPSETAVIRMVDDYEQTGAKVGFRQGWKLGWSKAAFRLWVIDLVVSLPGFLLLGILIGLGFLVYNNVAHGTEAAAVTTVVASVGCAFLSIFVVAIGGIFLRLLRQFFWRAAALENLGVRDSFRRGWEMFKGNWQSAALMWLVMLGLGIGFSIAMFVVFFLLIPVFLIALVAGLLVAAIPGFLFGWLVSLFAPTWVAVLVGIVIGAPILGIITGAPLHLINGWAKIFESNVWTLTYREMKAIESLKPADEPPAAELPAMAK
jgi:hypothetical protein